MKIFPQHFWRNKQRAYIGLLFLICLYTQNSCTASRSTSDSTATQAPQQAAQPAAPAESLPRATPKSLAPNQNSPLLHETPASPSLSLYLSPLDSALHSPLLAPSLLAPSLLAPSLVTPENIHIGTALTEDDELQHAVEELTSRLGDQIGPLKILGQGEQETTASQFPKDPESALLFSGIGSLTDTQFPTATTLSLFLPLITSQQQDRESPIVESPTSGPTPIPTPLPTPDNVFRVAKVPILMYHYLSVPPSGSDIYRRDLSVAPDLFARHLDSMLEAGYQTISLYELTMHLTIGTPLPAKPVVITFDDGYRDNYENAFPLLIARGMTATFFVSPEFIERERSEYADWPMLRTMYASGMSIEAHGLNHRSLKGRAVDFLAWQALASIQSIEREIGQRPRFVSYPAGEYDDLTIEVFKNSHFWAGFTTIQGATQQSDALFTMRRVRVRNTTQPNELIRLMELDW